MGGSKNIPVKLVLALTGLVVVILVAIILVIKNVESKSLPNLPIIKLSQENLDEILSRSGGANYVLLGESSHGTAEYYDWRRSLTKKLIEEKGFYYVVVEGDWASLYKVNRYVKHLNDDELDGRQILSSFERWPTWMWANEEFLLLVEWLREYNRDLTLENRVGIYGNDVYGISESIIEVIEYLDNYSPLLSLKAKESYECLLGYGNDYSSYVLDYVNSGQSCESQVKSVYHLFEKDSELYKKANQDKHGFFNARLNALAVLYGEAHYRNSASVGSEGWNTRVRFMKKAVNHLTDFYGKDSKGVVWAHNTHVGDARATDMLNAGMINIGQLLRQKYGEDRVYIVGFGTNKGLVLAGREWGAKMEIVVVPEAVPGSLEHYLNGISKDDFILFLREGGLSKELTEARGHRAKGVVYKPENEAGNYVTTLLADRYDAFIFINETRQLTPLSFD